MEWNNGDNNGYDHTQYVSHRDESMPEMGSEVRLDPLDTRNPLSANLFLSDDAQDKINGSDRKKMKCLSCGHRFTGKIYESCPKCFSLDTEKMTDATDQGF